jgi:hypothetical protein
MPDPIPKDLAEGFHEAVWCYHDWTPSLRESEVSINRQTYSMSAVCDVVHKFEDTLPEHVIKRLFHYMDATCHDLRLELGTRGTYSTGAYCFRELIVRRKDMHRRIEEVRRDGY